MLESADRRGKLARMPSSSDGLLDPPGLLSGRVRAADLARILYKRRWPALAAMTLVLGLSVLYNVTRVPMYEARVRLLIDAGKSNVVDFQEILEQDKNQWDYYQTQYRLLQSRSLATKNLDTLKAWEDPEFTTSPERSRIQKVADAMLNPVSTARGWVARMRPGPVSRPAGSPPPQAEIVDAFLSRLTVAPVGESRLVDATFVARDPNFAARAVNGLADQYVAQSRDEKAAASSQAIDWLREQLAEQQKQAQSSELLAQQYRERNDPITSSDRENIQLQKLSELTAAATRAKTARIQKESQYQQLLPLKEDPNAVAGLPLVLANPVIQEMRRQLADAERAHAQLANTFGPRHPEMVNAAAALEAIRTRVRGETEKIVAGVYSEYQAALAEEQSLTAALEAQRRETLASTRRAIDYTALERDVASNRGIVESLMQRMKEADITSGLNSSDIRIVDRAEVPRAPVPQTRGSLIMSAIVALMLGVAIAFGLEQIDNTIKTPEDVRTQLRLPFLGGLPHFERGADLTLPIHLVEPGHGFAEAAQAVRTNVLFSVAGDGPQTLLVTSTQPGEGKTVVAGHLAVALGQIGQRVALVDSDMRRPTLHERFGMAGSPGLSDVLAGTSFLRTALRQTEAQNVTLLAAGQHPPNPSVLLESPRFRELVAVLAQDYDWVIFDSPPVNAVTDSAIIAAQVGGVLFVVGAEMTNRHAATNALNQLEVAKAGFAGAVLNRMPVSSRSYYYANYSGYSRPPKTALGGKSRVVIRVPR